MVGTGATVTSLKDSSFSVKTHLAQLVSFLADLKVDAVLVSNPVNISYLTGYPSEDAWLLVTADRTFYITDFRYIEQARKAFGNKGIEVVEFEGSLFEKTVELLVHLRVKKCGFEENRLTWYQFNRLKSLAGGKVRLKALSGAVEALRVIKTPDEVLAIREAVRVNLKGFKYIEKFIRPGITERDILYKLQDFIRKENVGFAFPPIIASGPNSAYPHARVSGRELFPAEPVLVDFGVEKDAYKSDLTRMFFLGKMPRSFETTLRLIRGAQEAAYQKIKPGVKASAVDAAARAFLKKNGLAQYFGHSLGHGVGLETHEMPRMSGQSGDVLLENMVITVEP